MKIQFFCKYCGQRYTVDEKHIGIKTKCKKCGNIIQVPNKSIVSPESKTESNIKKHNSINVNKFYIISIFLIGIINAIIDVPFSGFPNSLDSKFSFLWYLIGLALGFFALCFFIALVIYFFKKLLKKKKSNLIKTAAIVSYILGPLFIYSRISIHKNNQDQIGYQQRSSIRNFSTYNIINENDVSAKFPTKPETIELKMKVDNIKIDILNYQANDEIGLYSLSIGDMNISLSNDYDKKNFISNVLEKLIRSQNVRKVCQKEQSNMEPFELSYSYINNYQNIEWIHMGMIFLRNDHQYIKLTLIYPTSQIKLIDNKYSSFINSFQLLDEPFLAKYLQKQNIILQSKNMNACRQNMASIESAANIGYASLALYGNERYPNSISEMINNDWINEIPVCPSGGEYIYNSNNGTVRCTIHSK